MIKGFSKLNKDEKIKWLTETYFTNPSEAQKVLAQYQNDDASLQKLHDEFSENTLTNYYLPLAWLPTSSSMARNTLSRWLWRKVR